MGWSFSFESPILWQVFVVGNEAADADSLVSAYAMAQLLNSSETQAIALAQIPREEFRLRGTGCVGGVLST